jgi:hypothetical protein
MTMARKFKLPEMPCQLGSKFVSNGEGEGEKREDVVKFSLHGLMLTAKSLDKILGADAAAHLFVRQGGESVVPRFGDDVNELKLVHRYVDSAVTLTLDDTTLTLAKAKIMNVVLQPQIGGMTWMGCDVEAPAEGDVDSIRKHTGHKISVQLAFGSKPELDKRQKSLALNEGDDDEGDEKPKAKKGNGQQPAAH